MRIFCQIKTFQQISQPANSISLTCNDKLTDLDQRRKSNIINIKLYQHQKKSSNGPRSLR